MEDGRRKTEDRRRKTEDNKQKIKDIPIAIGSKKTKIEEVYLNLANCQLPTNY